MLDFTTSIPTPRPETAETVSTVGLCDGFGLALEIIGQPITNSIMLGAFAKATGSVSLDSLNKGMETTAFRDAMLEKNIEAARRGYEETRTYYINQ